MKQLLIAGNWKSNKTVSEGMNWLHNVTLQTVNVKLILCVPFTLLYPLKQEISRLKLPLELGAQDTSPFGDGAYTGEVSARQLKELCNWVIIGHSERRQNFAETDGVLSQKTTQAKRAGLSVIYCVPDSASIVPPGVDVVAYEPVWAIGTGKSETPQNANSAIGRIKENAPYKRGIYGGSVTPDNVKSFTSQAAIDGVLPGGASLDPEKFFQLIANANS